MDKPNFEMEDDYTVEHEENYALYNEHKVDPWKTYLKKSGNSLTINVPSFIVKQHNLQAGEVVHAQFKYFRYFQDKDDEKEEEEWNNINSMLDDLNLLLPVEIRNKLTNNNLLFQYVLFKTYANSINRDFKEFIKEISMVNEKEKYILLEIEEAINNRQSK